MMLYLLPRTSRWCSVVAKEGRWRNRWFGDSHRVSSGNPGTLGFSPIRTSSVRSVSCNVILLFFTMTTMSIFFCRTTRITHVEREMMDRPRPVDRDVECLRWFVALPLRLVRHMRSGERLVKLDIENEGNSIILHTQYFFHRFPIKAEQKGHAQHIAFVLQFGRLCRLNRLLLGENLP